MSNDFLDVRIKTCVQCPKNIQPSFITILHYTYYYIHNNNNNNEYKSTHVWDWVLHKVL